MKKIIPILLILILFLCACGKKSPTSPEPPKPKASVNLAVSQDPFVFFYEQFFGYYWSIFNVIISESNGVGVTITTLKLEFRNGTTLVATVTLSGGTCSAYGTLEIAATPVIWEYFDEMKIIATGTDFNGYSISVTRIYGWV